MADIAGGFVVGDTRLPWGTRFDAACRALGLPPPDGGRYCHADVAPCERGLGEPAVGASLHGPAADRPVTGLTYQLRADGRAPAAVLASVAARLGAPKDTGTADLSGYGDPSGGVQLWASWKTPTHSIGLSIYGAPREEGGGEALGCLWVTWDDTIAAGAPYAAEWRASCERMAHAADRVRDFHRFTVSWDLHRGYDEDDDPPPSAELVAATRGLGRPNLLATPAVIAARLGPKDFALWSTGPWGVWAVSDARDSFWIVAGSGRMSVSDILPAKGPGHAELELGDWSARDAHGSKAIAAAADIARAIPGIVLAHHEGHDV